MSAFDAQHLPVLVYLFFPFYFSPYCYQEKHGKKLKTQKYQN